MQQPGYELCQPCLLLLPCHAQQLLQQRRCPAVKQLLAAEGAVVGLVEVLELMSASALAMLMVHRCPSAALPLAETQGDLIALAFVLRANLMG